MRSCKVAEFARLQKVSEFQNVFICLLDSFWGGGRGNDGGKRVWAYG